MVNTYPTFDRSRNARRSTPPKKELAAGGVTGAMQRTKSHH